MRILTAIFLFLAPALGLADTAFDYQCEGGNLQTGILHVHFQNQGEKYFIDGKPLKYDRQHDYFLSSVYPDAAIDFHHYATGGGYVLIRFPHKFTAQLLCNGRDMTVDDAALESRIAKEAARELKQAAREKTSKTPRGGSCWGPMPEECQSGICDSPTFSAWGTCH